MNEVPLKPMPHGGKDFNALTDLSRKVGNEIIQTLAEGELDPIDTYANLAQQMLSMMIMTMEDFGFGVVTDQMMERVVEKSKEVAKERPTIN